MSESTTEQPPAQAAQPATPAEPAAQTQGEPADKPLGENGEKALHAERESRKAAEKKAADLQAQIDKINQANETALEKAQREAKEAQENALKAGTDALRYRIAAEAGITENVELILTAPDEETMRKQADLWKDRTPAATTAAGPRPDLSQGGRGTPTSASPADQFGQFIRSQLGS